MKVFGMITTVLAIDRERQMPYSETLKCGDCIRSEKVFCIKGLASPRFSGTGAPTTKCCKDSTCPEAQSKDWSCSTEYRNLEYAITMCPQDETKCGANWLINFDSNQTSTPQVLSVKGLLKGDSCTYQVNTKCGGPTFRLTSDSTINVNTTNLSYLESSLSYITPDDAVGVSDLTTEVSSRISLRPRNNSFPRSTNFDYSGVQSIFD